MKPICIHHGDHPKGNLTNRWFQRSVAVQVGFSHQVPVCRETALHPLDERKMLGGPEGQANPTVIPVG